MIELLDLVLWAHSGLDQWKSFKKANHSQASIFASTSFVPYGMKKSWQSQSCPDRKNDQLLHL